jgi:8-oxo-dGTP pyrophosphatase MutT (NUDIX family)
MEVIPIQHEPQLVYIDAPILSEEAQATVGEKRQLLTNKPGAFDGSQLMCQQITATTIQVYPATYAWRLAHNSLQVDGVSPYGLGGLGVGIVLSRPDGALLWVQRGPELVLAPYCWELSAYGGVEVDATPQGTLAAELHEELGLSVEDYTVPEAIGVIVGPGGGGCALLYKAAIMPTAVITPTATEVADLRWSHQPTEDMDLTRVTRLLWAERSALGIT